MELNGREDYIVHIEGLQATLTKRNVRIAELEKQLKDAETTALESRAVKKAYKQGWQACASRLMDITRKTALDLSEVRKEAWRVYSEGEK